MWKRVFSQEYQGVRKEAIWQAWADVNNWPQWDNELEYCDMKADFSKGNQFILKPKGGPKILLFLSEVIPNYKFIDRCKFFGAIMSDAHELEDTVAGVRITNTITVTGPLSFLWANLVAKNVAKGVPEQTTNLVEYARSKYE
jgi:hypothetical protein